jgi:hypothetical protein
MHNEQLKIEPWKALSKNPVGSKACKCCSGHKRNPGRKSQALRSLLFEFASNVFVFERSKEWLEAAHKNVFDIAP